MNRPRGLGYDDAVSDAAIILIEMRARWSPGRAEHLSEERQERMAIAWARLRLIDKYEAEFARQKRTISLHSAGMDKPIDVPAPEQTLTDLDREDIERLVDKLPERAATVVKMLLFEGRTQREVAVALGVSQPAISSTFDRAREQLVTLLADYSETLP